MGFFDKVKKAFKSKKEDVESQGDDEKGKLKTLDEALTNEYLKEFDKLNTTTGSIFDLEGYNVLIILKDGTNLITWDDVKNKDDIIYVSENLSNYDDLKEKYAGLKSLKAIVTSEISNKVTSLCWMFAGCSSLRDIASLSKWNTQQVTEMCWMFESCSSLTDISGLSKWDTQQVTDMGGMFTGCSSLTDISGLSKWDTQQVRNMEAMFMNCSSLVDLSSLSNWDTSHARKDYIFENCESIKAYPLWDERSKSNKLTTSKQTFVDSSSKLLEAINRGIKNIVLESDIIIDGEHRYGIELKNNNVVIDGKGHTINGNGGRIFQIFGKRITFKSIKFKDAHVGFSLPNRDHTYREGVSFGQGDYVALGGAIINYGECTFIDCDFINNGVGSDLKGTSALNLYDFYSAGGAILNIGTCYLISCKFSDNKVVGQYLGPKNIRSEGYCALQNCIFEDVSDFSGVEFVNQISYDSFDKLNGLIQNSRQVALDSDIVLSSEEESKYAEGIIYERNYRLVIDGNGHTIDAKGKTRIFNVKRGHVVLKNIKIKNGYSDENGGAILNSADLSIENCSLENNEAKYGGAIYNSWGMLNISNTSFNKNSSQKVDSNDIFNNGCLTLKDSHFSKKTIFNNSNIYLYDDSLLDFIENQSNLFFITPLSETERNFNYLEELIKNNGNAEIKLEYDIVLDLFNEELGGIYISDYMIKKNQLVIDGKGHTIDAKGKTRIFNIGSGNVVLKNITLKNGYSAEKGGAIHNGGEITIIDSVFEKNVSKKGGAIYNDGKLSFSKSKFIYNKSSNSIIFNDGLIILENCILCNNISNNIIANEKNLNLSYGKIIENNIKNSALHNNGECSINRTIFDNNHFEKENMINILNKANLTFYHFNINGKTIFNEGKILIKDEICKLDEKIENNGIIKHLDFVSESETDFTFLDMQIHEEKREKIKLTQDITIEDYERDFYEGGIELDMDNLIIDGDNHVIDGNKLSRIFIVTGKNITLKNIIFKNGSAYTDYLESRNCNGGVLRIHSHCDVTIMNCKFLSNSSEDRGSILYNLGKVTLKNSEIQENFSKVSGAIYNDMDSAQISIFNSKFIKNDAPLFNSNGELKILNSDFIKNKSSIGNNDNLTITKSQFIQNTTGAIYNNKSGKLIITESKFNTNKSGAITNLGEATISKSEFAKNISESIIEGVFSTYGGRLATGGGAISNKGKLIIKDCDFIKNVAKDSGGAIFNQKSAEIIVKNSNFESNSSEKSQGVICNVGGKINLSDCIFIGSDKEIANIYFGYSLTSGLAGYERGEIILDGVDISIRTGFNLNEP